MELADYLLILRKHWISVVAVTLAGILLAGVVSLLMHPTYTASTSVFLTVQSGSSAGELQQGSTYAENQVKSFAQVVTAPAVLTPVIDKLGLQTTTTELAKKVTASVPTSTAIIEIDVVGTDPVQTAQITAAIGAQLVTVVGELSPTGSKDEQTVKATIIAPAIVPTEWTSPRVALNLALGALLGLLIGVGQAVIRDRMDTTVVAEDDLAEVTDRSVVGVVAFDTDAPEHPLVFAADSHSVRAEAYRRLRTNLQFLAVQSRNRSVVVTSSVQGEGKTTSSINLAFALADAGDRVLLIDADLRQPKVADYLNMEGSAGLTTLLIGQATLAEVVQPVGTGRLEVLPSGQVPPNPAELLGSIEMEEVLNTALASYDVVVIDTSPTLAVTDSAVLSQVAGGTLLIVGSGTVKKPELAASIEALEAVDSNIMGLVLNKVKVDRGGAYRYQHQYRHEYRPVTEPVESGEAPGHLAARSAGDSPASFAAGRM